MRYELTKTFVLMAIIAVFTFLISSKYEKTGIVKMFDGGNTASVFAPQISSVATSTIKGTPIKNSVSKVAVENNTPILEDSINWQKFASDSLGLSVKYPSDFIVNQSGDGSIEFAKFGTGQVSKKALADGLVLNLNVGTYKENNLLQYVQSKVDEARSQSFVKDISTINQIERAGIMGYQYTVTTTSDNSYIYLPNGQNEYILITSTVKDPQNKGYDNLVESVLSTLELQISV